MDKDNLYWIGQVRCYRRRAVLLPEKIYSNESFSQNFLCADSKSDLNSLIKGSEC